MRGGMKRGERKRTGLATVPAAPAHFSFKAILPVFLKVPLTDMQDSTAAKAICPEGSLLALYTNILFLID